MISWREVEEDEFYRVIGPQNVHPRIEPGSYPWATVYVTPNGEQRGKVIDITTNHGGTEENRYLLPNA